MINAIFAVSISKLVLFQIYAKDKVNPSTRKSFDVVFCKKIRF